MADPREGEIAESTGIYEVDRITVQQDVGGPYPRYKKVDLVLWSNGTVAWENLR